MGILLYTRMVRVFLELQGLMKVVGILLYTLEAGRVYYGVGDVSAYTGIIFNTRVAGDDECWGALGVNLGNVLEECPQ
mgnify:CR=1 FL=1